MRPTRMVWKFSGARKPSNELYKKCSLQSLFSDGLDVYRSWGCANAVLFTECIGRGMILK